MVYLGKEPGTKAHWLYDPKDEKLHVSKDVVFEESRTWKWELQGDSEVIVLGSFTVVDNYSTIIAEEEIEEPATPVQSTLSHTLNTPQIIEDRETWSDESIDEQ